MDIKRTNTKALLEFFLDMRISGTTTLIEKVDKTENIIVIVNSVEQKGKFKNAFSLSDLVNKKTRGISRKPYLLDNHVLLKVLGECEDNLDAMKQIIDSKQFKIEVLQKGNDDLHKRNKELNDQMLKYRSSSLTYLFEKIKAKFNK